MSLLDRDVRLNSPKAEIVPPRGYSASEIEKIRELAYAAYSARLGGPGDALSDWLEAERMFQGTSRPVEDGPVSRSLPIQAIPAKPAAMKPPGRLTSSKPVGA